MLVLASASPRRQELLRLIKEDFVVLAADVDETIDAGTDPRLAVEQLALRKAKAIATSRPHDTVIGADTIVVYEGKIFGKPKDSDDACDMLRQLSGKTHTVYTGVCVIDKMDELVFSDCCDVTFASMSDSEIAEYVATNEPMDKAGAYGIQGKGAVFIESIRGNFYTVMGLPIHLLYKSLRKNSLI